MRTSPFLATLSLIVWLLCGCAKKPAVVSGQIVVVTASREEVRMGSIAIHVVGDEQFKAVAASLAAEIREQVGKDAQQRADSDARNAFISHVLSLETAELEVPELAALRKQAAGDAANQMLAALQYPSMTLARATALLMQAIPPATVTSDAEGRFTTAIRSKVWLIACGERLLGKDRETYLWVVPCAYQASSPRAPILISNESNVDLLQLYALLAAEAGMPTDLKPYTQAAVGKALAQWIEEATGRAAAVSGAASAIAKPASSAVDRETAVAAWLAQQPKAAADHLAQQVAAGAEVAPAARPEAATVSALETAIRAGALGKTLAVPLPGGTFVRFAYCPAGSFLMGSPAGEKDRCGDEKQVSVEISKGFWMAATEVTQGQWKALLGKNPSHFAGSSELPVEQVSWDDAQKFIAKLNLSGLLPAGWTFALPTEAQWEYACRAGTTGAYAAIPLDHIGWFDRNSGRKSHEVGQKPANAWGICDMHGNVWEWCADWYRESLAGGKDPTGAVAGVDRVGRGGSWDGSAADCRSANRGWLSPQSRSANLGFRPALVPIK